jgi:hypothetical protein
MVAGLAAMGPVTLREQRYAGEYLAALVSVDPENLAAEAARTPQLISELGRLVAAAMRDKEMREVEYRVWRDTTEHELTNDIEAAANAGFECATKPRKSAKGEAKDPKCPGSGAVDVYIRSLPEYREHYEAKLFAEEAWAALHAAYTAAQSRSQAVRAFGDNGGAAPRRGESIDNGAAEPDPHDGTVRHSGRGEDTGDAEARVTIAPRTALPSVTPSAPPPPPPRVATSAPPPPPPASPRASPGPPPPPSRR